MLSQYPQSAFQEVLRGRQGGGQQQFVTQTLRIHLLGILKNKNSAQRGSFWDGHPADIRGSFARISRPKTSVRAAKIMEKNKRFSADVHDPKARTSMIRNFQKLRSEKLPLVEIRARQRSGEGAARRNSRPKRCFWRVRFFSSPLEVFMRFKSNLKNGGKRRNGLSKSTLLDDRFSARRLRRSFGAL